ncbi:TadE-like protein [Gimesia maris]|nr:TadE-like protein [Gimesia maris]
MQLSGPRSLLNNGNSRFSSVTEDRQRTGSVLLEFILAFPLILIISLAIIEFGFFALLQQTVTVATIEGSREAAQVGTTTDSVGNLIKQYVALNSLNLVVTSPATSNAGNVLETGRCVTPLIRQKNQSSTQIRYVQ